MAAFSFTVAGAAARLEAQGEWTIDRAADIDAELRSLAPNVAGLKQVLIGADQPEKMDTIGAWLLVRTRDGFRAAGIGAEIEVTDDNRRVLISAVAERRVGDPPQAKGATPFIDLVEKTGLHAREAGRDAVEVVAFFGQVARRFAYVAIRPRRLRIASVITHVERMGLHALPIVILISALVGAIIAQQGAFQLRAYGAESFTIQLVGALTLREVGLLLAAIIFAGRSGSATTAEIGAMRMREEIDAMRVIGLDPIEVLVLPRLIALIIALPIVTVVSNIAGLGGALVACWLYLGMPPTVFLETLRGVITVNQLVVGLTKAPFMALIIGVVACIEGLKVRGSTESLGFHTTAAVVKAIFLVIVVDGIFAIVFSFIGM